MEKFGNPCSKLHNEFTSHLHLVSHHEMIHEPSVQTQVLSAVSELWKWQHFWLAIALKKSTDMSLIGYIAQRCKNTLDSFPDLLIVFAFVWGYLSMTDDIRGATAPPNVAHATCTVTYWSRAWSPPFRDWAAGQYSNMITTPNTPPRRPLPC